MSLDFFEGSRNLDKKDWEPVFLYHIQKTAGMTFFTSLKMAMAHLFEVKANNGQDFKEPLITRIDEYSNLKAIIERKGELPSSAFIASHLPFGVHERFEEPFKVVTLLRDPVKRVKSKYTYTKMRSKDKVDLEDFCDFFKLEENKNVAVKQLSGGCSEDISNFSMLERAILNLETYFYAYSTTDSINEMCSHFLKMNRLPNVLAERLNPTLDAYRLDVSKYYNKVFFENYLDVLLFSYVKENPRIPGLPQKIAEDRHPYTLLTREVGDEEAHKSRTVRLPTEKVVPFLENSRFCSKKILSRIR